MDDQLWWLNRPACLEWREEADETPNAFRWLVELIPGMHDAFTSTRASELRADRRDDRVRAGLASGYRRQDSTSRGSV
jgi:hypothetical protein